MSNRFGSISEMLEAVQLKCHSWIRKDSQDSLVIVDPNDGEPIAAHYAMTHYAAAMILGYPEGSPEFIEGIEMTEGLLRRWSEDTNLPGYHNDFNNMAMCMIEEELSAREVYGNLCTRIRDAVSNTPDSNNPTVNWLPMRIYVNTRRKAWGNTAARKTIAKIESDIEKSWNIDGFIEDRIPKGISFNLQYDVATVAVLELLNSKGSSYNLDKAVEALVNALGPDGDINYLGRGCNQVFAWGPWLYLLKSRGQRRAFDLSSGFLASRLQAMLDNDNLLLNSFSGSAKDFWWDYHYASVYTCHLLLWLVLCDKLQVEWSDDIVPACSYGSESGIRIYRTENAFLCEFSGRKGYLAETGPVVAQLYTEKGGTLVKGTNGPWLKAFGEKYSTVGSLLNHFGLLKVGQRFGFSMKVEFSLSSTEVDPERVIFSFYSRSGGRHVMNFPLVNKRALEDIKVFADGHEVPLRELARLKNQYGYVIVLQSSPSFAREWRVEVML